MAVYSLGERRVVLTGSEWYIADGAVLVGSVVLGDQASVWFNATIRADNDTIVIGERSNVQDGAVLHADPGAPIAIGREVTIGHKAMVHGCTIGDGTLLGINSVLLNHCVIGSEVLIGANSLIPEGRTIPDGVLVVGAPGKIVRELTPEERRKLREAADGYVAKGRRYREQLQHQSLI